MIQETFVPRRVSRKKRGVASALHDGSAGSPRELPSLVTGRHQRPAATPEAAARVPVWMRGASTPVEDLVVLLKSGKAWAAQVEASYALLTANEAQFAAAYERHLLMDHPELSVKYDRAQQRRQHHNLIPALARVVHEIHDPLSLRSVLSGLGDRHARYYNVTAEEVRWAGEAFLSTFSALFPHEWTNEEQQSFCVAFNTIVEMMWGGQSMGDVRMARMTVDQLENVLDEPGEEGYDTYMLNQQGGTKAPRRHSLGGMAKGGVIGLGVEVGGMMELLAGKVGASALFPSSSQPQPRSSLVLFPRRQKGGSEELDGQRGEAEGRPDAGGDDGGGGGADDYGNSTAEIGDALEIGDEQDGECVVGVGGGDDDGGVGDSDDEEEKNHDNDGDEDDSESDDEDGDGGGGGAPVGRGALASLRQNTAFVDFAAQMLIAEDATTDEIVRASFAVLGKFEDVGMEFYKRLFASHPDLKHLFKGDMSVMHIKIVKALAVVCASLSQEEYFESMLVDMGKRHMGYGALPHHLDYVGAALLDTIQHFHEIDGTWDPRIGAAWGSVFGKICACMIKGLTSYEVKELKGFSRFEKKERVREMEEQYPWRRKIREAKKALVRCIRMVPVWVVFFASAFSLVLLNNYEGDGNWLNELLLQSESILIICGVYGWWKEGAEREVSREMDLWAAIDGADGILSSKPRLRALEELCRMKVPLDDMTLNGSFMQRIRLPSVSMRRCQFRGADFKSALLRKARLQYTDAKGAIFVGADIARADAAFASFDGANLAYANVSKANLVATSFVNCNLSGTNFSGSQLTGAKFTGSYACGANFTDTQMTRSMLIQQGCVIDASTKVRGRIIVEKKGIEATRGNSTSSLGDSGTGPDSPAGASVKKGASVRGGIAQRVKKFSFSWKRGRKRRSSKREEIDELI